MVEARIDQVVKGIAAAHGLTFTIEYDRRYPVLVNSETESAGVRCGMPSPAHPLGKPSSPLPYAAAVSLLINSVKNMRSP